MRVFILLFSICFLYGCASYYQVNLAFNQDFERGDMLAAETVLVQNTKAADSKEKFLYYLNRGTVAAMLDKPEESNSYFEQAYLFGEDYQTNYFNEVGAFVVNPMVIEYKGEDHEHLVLLYYKCLNYLKMGDHENALVECRRLNQRLFELNDKYKNETKYQRDAFVHNLMGLIYDADGDYNNAFIAYRNALDIYKTDYANMFDADVPLQLKKDILRTAYVLGFHSELDQYQKEFSMVHSPVKESGADLIFLWNNGLGPVKYEFSINFVVTHGSGGLVTFSNEQEGYYFPFALSNDEETELNDLEFYRLAVPRYRQRQPVFRKATLLSGLEEYPLELAEDLNQIALYSLEQRMAIELGKSLLRLAIKKAAEKELKKEDEDLGALLGMINAMTEKADTRNWQTIPHSIYYTRAKIPAGESSVILQIGEDNNYAQAHEFKFNAQAGETLFHAFYSLESVLTPSSYSSY